jgi:hypothetical protein
VSSPSILSSVKKILGLAESYEAFDLDIIIHINTVFGTLNQLGIGPDDGFEIEDATPTWDAFTGGDPRLNGVKTYTYLRVRFLFDPPTTSYLIDAVNNQIKEFEWRLSAYREMTGWTDPSGIQELETVLDGGTP